MAELTFDSSLANQTSNLLSSIPQASRQGALAGFQIGQQFAERRALNNVDANNPQSVDQGIGNLAKAGLFDQAQAFQNLQLARYRYGQVEKSGGDLQRYYDKFGNGGATSNQPSQQNQPSSQTSQIDPAKAHSIAMEASVASKELLDTPVADRPARAAQIKQTMLQHGVPEQAIDQALSGITDDNQLKAHKVKFDALADHFNDVAQNPPPPNQPSQQGVPNGSQIEWAQRWTDPVSGGYGAENRAKTLGLPIQGYNDLAEKILGPVYAKNAEIGAAPQLGTIAAETARKSQLALQPGDRVTLKVNGVEHVVPADVAERALHNPDAAALGIGVDLSPQQRAQQEALGHGAGELVDIPITDPTTGVTKTVKMTPTDYITQRRSGAIPSAVGSSPTDQQRIANASDAQALAKWRDQASNPDVNSKLQSTIDNATRGRALLKSINTNDLTPHAQQLANAFNAIGIPQASKDANNLAIYAQAANTALLAHSHDFAGRNTDKDLAIERSVVPSITTPKDAASFAFATQQASANRQSQWLKFVAENPNETSNRALLSKFNAGPNSGSLYADPAFRDLTINGKPAVEIHPPIHGHQYGVFLPGTKSETTFVVK